ncbi:dipeptidyl peptidase IV/CD26, N-terminal domain-containing protein [Metschnikowia bicuspidata var. bicuspidata NRRL YB-4993]|uniref:Dipeptidyl peptidase IV/CD26, N-terminal domain-containing protein n=1 Tax=Metschnikowia bicuspidata var. bicuspidata NRRL YB-4993 TaxID=869754 RepID=A0A1A0HC35_9ASCO|nr:dipeptidyl peptidase IV/CD26, N-terminal domain-containing protein [Metschnikowia bicuspidata var. bicuspidata NRRL YB-4993]OBA21545.1 dipeptidyl peptidase IV/CD26, N-terminal domain-containing protein [Metschnikowia bicuspidata var. bicuspidata NRRL YB-4993]
MRGDSYKRLDTEPFEAIPLETLRSHEINDAQLALNTGVVDGETDSDDSATSQLFEDISHALKSAQNEETFEHDPGFQVQWNIFTKGGDFSRRAAMLLGVFCVLIWAVSLIVYSNGNARINAALLWHGAETNIVELSHRNISLNSFNPSLKNASFPDLRKGLYTPSFSPLRWLQNAQFPASRGSDSKGYYVTRKQDKLVVCLADQKYEETILDSNQFAYQNKFYYAQDVILNPGQPVNNRSAMHLLRSDLVAQWRHSSFSFFWLWKPITGEVFPVQPPSKKLGVDLQKIHFARFDPSGRHLVFGFEHDLYLMDVNTRDILPVTNTGSLDVFNGKPDWVLEEEVYPHDHMVWWSPDLKHMVYAQINDTEVEAYDLDYYVKGSGEVAMSYKDMAPSVKPGGLNQYPKHTSIKYPKPGTPNPKTRLYSYSMEQKTTTEIAGVSNKVVKDDYLLYDAAWVDQNNFLIKVSDRHSSVLEKKLYCPADSSGATLVSFQNASDYSGWIEKTPPITLAKRGGLIQYLDRVVVDDVVQLALFDLASSKDYSKLLGPVSYNSPLSYDELEDCVYGIFGTNLNSSFALVSLTNANKTELATDGDFVLNFSPNGQFLELVYMGPALPWTKVINMALVAENAGYISQRENFDDSARFSAVISSTNLPTRVLSSVRVGRESEHVNVIEIFPPNFRREKKHPLLVHAYGGPGSTTVNRAFGVDFQDIVSSQLNAVVLIIDPRGTGSDDWKLKAHLKGNMGLWEPQDIVAITKDYVAANAYVDDQKTAIWGWSYGGFTALKTLEFDKGNVFKYGMAVAPVTNWLFYDSVFTERIMGDPKTNNNYQAISRINDFAVFKDVKRFLIMQGTADDNVHMQNAMWLMDNFDQAGVENYDVHFFPDSDHSINYNNANTVVYDKLFWWLKQAFTGYFIEM